jgi:hypothetical protein
LTENYNNLKNLTTKDGSLDAIHTNHEMKTNVYHLLKEIKENIKLKYGCPQYLVVTKNTFIDYAFLQYAVFKIVYYLIKAFPKYDVIFSKMSWADYFPDWSMINDKVGKKWFMNPRNSFNKRFSKIYKENNPLIIIDCGSSGCKFEINKKHEKYPKCKKILEHMVFEKKLPALQSLKYSDRNKGTQNRAIIQKSIPQYVLITEFLKAIHFLSLEKTYEISVQDINDRWIQFKKENAKGRLRIDSYYIPYDTDYSRILCATAGMRAYIAGDNLISDDTQKFIKNFGKDYCYIFTGKMEALWEYNASQQIIEDSISKKNEEYNGKLNKNKINKKRLDKLEKRKKLNKNLVVASMGGQSTQIAVGTESPKDLLTSNEMGAIAVLRNCCCGESPISEGEGSKIKGLRSHNLKTTCSNLAFDLQDFLESIIFTVLRNNIWAQKRTYYYIREIHKELTGVIPNENKVKHRRIIPEMHAKKSKIVYLEKADTGDLVRRKQNINIRDTDNKLSDSEVGIGDLRCEEINVNKKTRRKYGI